MAELTFRIEVPSVQKATAVRDRCADWLAADPDIRVVSQSMSPVTHPFNVVGVDTAGKQPFSERVEAKDRTEAETVAIGKSKTRVVAEVREAV